MIGSLNIPLTEPTTRRRSWRVVWILFIITTFLLIGWSAFRLLTHFDRVSSFRPEAAEQSITFYKNARTARTLSSNLGQKTAFFGHSWVVQDFINHASSSISFHYGDVDLIGISIDNRLPEQFKLELQHKGLFVYEDHGQTLVSIENVESAVPSLRLSTKVLFPGTNGLFISHSENSSAVSAVHVNNRGVKIRERNELPTPAIQFSYPESLDVITFAPLDTSSFVDFLPILDKKEAIVMLGKDENGLAIYISSQIGEIDIDQLAETAQQIINRQSLSTTALTLPDGESVDEIRTQQGTLTPSIMTQGDIKTVFIQNDQGDLVWVGEDDGYLVVSNRSTVINNISDGGPVSTCHPHYPFFVRVAEVAALTFEPAPNPLLPPDGISKLFSEVAWRPKATFMCW